MEYSISDIDFLKQAYNTARNRYKPRHIRVLFIAEAPPCSLDRFFYFEDVKTQDSLFLEIMGQLYPREKENYLKSGRDTVLKAEILEKFKLDGYWLLDLSEIPTSISTFPLNNCLPSLITRLEKYIDKSIPIILIKSNVYDTCYLNLRSKGYNVIDERMPFPGSGQQKVFRDKFEKALNLC
jgi:hypothetical protein